MLAISEVSVIKGSNKSIKESIKLKIRKLSKSQKLSKFWISTKLGKKLLKSGNSSNFNIKKNGSSFSTFDAKTAFNRLRLAFIKALILWNFDSKYHIQIETNILDYAISGILYQLIFGTNFNGIITKTNLNQ